MLSMLYFFLVIFLSIILESFPISSSGNINVLLFYLEKYYHILFDPTLLADVDYFINVPIALTLSLFFCKRWWLLLKTFPRSLPILIKIISLGFITELITVLFFIFFSFITIPLSMIAIGFIITSGVLYSLRFEYFQKRVTWSWQSALVLGTVQGLALLPGISRFGSTFCAARWLGMRSQRAFELSFLISFPINSAAGLLGLFKLYQHNTLYILSFPLLFIMLIGVVGAYCGLWWVSHVIKTNKLWIFSVYTLLLAIISFFL